MAEIPAWSAFLFHLFPIFFYLFYAIFKLWPQHAKKCQQTIKLEARRKLEEGEGE